MKVLITGASGFIGKRLVEYFAEQLEADVYAVARDARDVSECSERVEWIQADLAERRCLDALPRVDVDVILHLAQSRKYRDFPGGASDMVALNVASTVALAHWGAERGVKRFVYTSTGNVYGGSASEYAETDPCIPETMYGASKLSGELLLKPFASVMSVVVLRLFGIYGPGQVDALIPNIVSKLVSGGEITLARSVGVRLNPMYVDDCVAALARFSVLSTGSNYEIYNVGGREVADLATVVRILEGLLGRRAVIRETGDAPKNLVGHIGKMADIMDVSGMVNLKTGLSLACGGLALPVC
jgi:UDP-glucose 4-epimerase